MSQVAGIPLQDCVASGRVLKSGRVAHKRPLLIWLEELWKRNLSRSPEHWWDQRPSPTETRSKEEQALKVENKDLFSLPVTMLVGQRTGGESWAVDVGTGTRW